MSAGKIVGVLVVAGGAATATTLLLTGEGSMPGWRALSEDSGDGYTNKYGASYSKFLVGVADSAKEGSKYKDIDNKLWWEWIFKNRFEPRKAILNDKFSTVEKATGTEKSLQSVCKEAYNDNLNGDNNNGKIKTTMTNKEAENFLEDNIWIFCSPGNGKPKTISQVETEKSTYTVSNSWGQKGDSQALLVAITPQENDWFWKIKEEEFFTATANPSSENDSEFKKLYDTHKNSMNLTTRKVKEMCSEAYKAQNSDHNTKYKEDEVYKFCSLKGQKT